MAVNFKKLNYTVTAYFNTLFNGIDIPANGAVLDSAVKKVYSDSYYLREDIDLPSISINDNYHNLVDVDYIKLVSNDNPTTVYYYFASPRSAAGNTTILDLELDALTTMGGAASLNYISGWQSRGHIPKNEDYLFDNIAPEDWSPSCPLVCSDYVTIEPPSNNQAPHPTEDLQIVITNIDLEKLGQAASQENIINVIKGVVDSGGDVEETDMNVPLIEASEHSTVFGMYVLEDTGGTPVTTLTSLSIPNTCAYDVTNPVIRKGLDLLFSCGQLQLQGSYTIPKELIVAGDKTVANPNGRYINITGFSYMNFLNEIPFIYAEDDYTVKNNKCFSMFRSVTLSNISSGGTITKPIYETYFERFPNQPNVTVWNDPVSTGKPYAKFLSDWSSRIGFVDTVTGSPWINNQILMEGASGSVWNTLNASLTQQSIQRDIDSEKKNHQYAKAGLLNDRSILDLNYEMQQKGNMFGLGSSGLGVIGGAALATVALTQPEISIPMFVGGAASSWGGVISGTKTLSNKSIQQDLYNIQRENANNALLQENYRDHFALDRFRQAANENKLGLIKANGVVAPTTYFTPDYNLAMYGYNKFVAFETKLKKDDLISLDQYFQRFGYNGLHKPLTGNSFNCRDYYCYVQAFDINLKAGTGYGMRVRNKAISQLNTGVRVWKVLPDAQYYELN